MRWHIGHTGYILEGIGGKFLEGKDTIFLEIQQRSRKRNDASLGEKKFNTSQGGYSRGSGRKEGVLEMKDFLSARVWNQI